MQVTHTSSATQLRLLGTCALALLLRPSPFIQAQANKWLGWLPKPCHHRTAFGFTLAELLISLAILGVIATFTIPKIISGQQNSSDNAKAHQAASMVAAAFQQYTTNNTLSASTKPSVLTQYMNYTAADTSTVLDDTYNLTTMTCNGTTNICIKLHDGSRLLLYDGASFGGTANNNAIWIMMDPDGKVTDGTTNGPGKSVWFGLYYTGRLASWGTMTNPTLSSDGTRTPTTYGASDPPWFTW